MEKPTCGNIRHTANWAGRIEADRFNLRGKIKHSWLDDLSSTAVQARGSRWCDSRRFMHKLIQTPPKHGQNQWRRKHKEEKNMFLIQLLSLCDTHKEYYTAHMQTDKRTHTHTSQVDQLNPGISIHRGQITAIKISKCSFSLGHRVKLLKTLLTWWSPVTWKAMQDYSMCMHVCVWVCTRPISQYLMCAFYVWLLLLVF